MAATTQTAPQSLDLENKTDAQPSNTWLVRKRDGRIETFAADRITHAVQQAMAATTLHTDLLPQKSAPISLEADAITQAVCKQLQQQGHKSQAGNPLDVETIQDMVENQLMQAGWFDVAKKYIVYREVRSRARLLRGESNDGQRRIHITQTDGSRQPLDMHTLKQTLYTACQDLPDCSPTLLLESTLNTVFDGISQEDFDQALVMVARQQIEREPAYNQVAVRLLLTTLYQQSFTGQTNPSQPEALALLPLPDLIARHQSQPTQHASGFKTCLEAGVEAKLIDPELLTFDLPTIQAALAPERDLAFQYLGLQTLVDRYLLHIDGRRIETPQWFWMRVAMGLALREDPNEREQHAIRFYQLLSSFRFLSATPTLFNAGTTHPQLSSCYLSTVDDDLSHIFKCVQDNAMLSKWAGGLGNDWTRVRATGAHIRGTNGKSQGIVPFLKVANDTALAVNQGGKRKGAVCAYLETWHLDIEAFLELRKNTGDDRRRTHDMHTAHWIPDLFMQRVQEDGHWTLFSPDEVPELHELFGPQFTAAYTACEAKAERGALRQHRRVEAKTLWRKMLSMVFETGHPWLTFKDPSNLRSPQDHTGVVHHSNLCTEILLNTSNDETAVCNLGSVNLKAHTTKNGVDHAMLKDTIHTAMRILDNVIDINFYPTKEAKQANQRHRPVGLGLMGFQDALCIQRIPYGSQQAIAFADQIGEHIAFHAISASSDLAKQRGTYASYAGSKWDRGLLPIDTVGLLAEARGGTLEQSTDSQLDWQPVRDAIAKHGMRNSNTMAIAPTATIANIAGCSQSIEPTYRNLYVKSNLSGDFTIVNEHLVNDLKQLCLWDDNMLETLKHHDGALGPIPNIPDDLKTLHQTAFEIDANALIEATSRRQKWIDMGISFNLYLAEPSGPALSQMYMTCWQKGLKTTYYLRSQAATQVEKTSIDVNRHGIQPKWMKHKSASAEIQTTAANAPVATHPVAPKACSILDPDCDACQ